MRPGDLLLINGQTGYLERVKNDGLTLFVRLKLGVDTSFIMERYKDGHALTVKSPSHRESSAKVLAVQIAENGALRAKLELSNSLYENVVPTNPELFYITHIDNLPSILTSKFLLSDRRISGSGGPTQSIGMSKIKHRR